MNITIIIKVFVLNVNKNDYNIYEDVIKNEV